MISLKQDKGLEISRDKVSAQPNLIYSFPTTTLKDNFPVGEMKT